MSTTAIFTLPFTPVTVMVVLPLVGLGKMAQVAPSTSLIPTDWVVKLVLTKSLYWPSPQTVRTLAT